MSALTKKHHAKKVTVISEKGEVYRLPSSFLEEYEDYRVQSQMRAKELIKKVQSQIKADNDEAFKSINEKYSKPGALLKGIRLREGKNQIDFAKMLNVTQGDLSKMERGMRPIGRTIAMRIAKKFHINYRLLLS